MYATVTSKGQVTLPVELRRALGIEPGQTIGFEHNGGQTTLQVPDAADAVRDALEQAARRQGTWGKTGAAGSAWQEAAVSRYADA